MEKSGSLVSQTAKWDVGSQRTSSLMGLGVGTRCDVLQVSQIAERGPVSCLGLGDSAPFPNLWIFFLSFFFCVCVWFFGDFFLVCLFVLFCFCFKHSLFPSGHQECGDPIQAPLFSSQWGWEKELVNRTKGTPWGRDAGPNPYRGVCATSVMAHSNFWLSAL